MRDEARADARTGLPSARILVADDHELVREGFQRALSREPGLEVVGEAANGREAVELCRCLKPDLVLMDVRMPKMDGLEATRAIKAKQPEVSVLVVSTYENPDYLLEAIRAGAAGYVLKGARKGQLVDAVRSVLNGESPLNQELATQLLQRLASETQRPVEQPPAAKEKELAAARGSLLEDLTPRELEVLGLVAQGKTNPQIAETLVISRGTAKIHVERIIRKLGVSDRTQAVVRGIEMGLLKP